MKREKYNITWKWEGVQYSAVAHTWNAARRKVIATVRTVATEQGYCEAESNITKMVGRQHHAGTFLWRGMVTNEEILFTIEKE